MEVEAKRKLIRFQDRYGIPDSENAQTIVELERLLKMGQPR